MLERFWDYIKRKKKGKSKKSEGDKRTSVILGE
jgi:hypothetical protein